LNLHDRAAASDLKLARLPVGHISLMLLSRCKVLVVSEKREPVKSTGSRSVGVKAPRVEGRSALS